MSDTPVQSATTPGAAPERRRICLSTHSIVRARYDAAQTTADNSRHWANADALSANQANSPSVRQTLRSRARYEAATNSYCRGIVDTLANDVIGQGPILQVELEDKELARRIERYWQDYADEIGLSMLLRTARTARAIDGESFALLTSAELSGPVSLFPRLIEAEQCASPALLLQQVDGILLDTARRPRAYQILREHPGDAVIAVTNEYDVIEKQYVLHHFRHVRPGQYRGVPEITPALPLFAQLRRYTLAVIAAAETAADFAAVIESDASPDTAVDVEPMDTVSLEKRMATTLPSGWKLGQIKAEQPVTTYDMFKTEILNEIARCLNMPLNIATCNSSRYNYASGRLDHQTYYKSVLVDRRETESIEVSPLFLAWYREARFSIGDLRAAPPALRFSWMWDSGEHVDPAKEANAQLTKLKAGTTGHHAEYARKGEDWEKEMTAAARCLGLTLTEYQAALRASLFNSAPVDRAAADSQGTDEDDREDGEGNDK